MHELVTIAATLPGVDLRHGIQEALTVIASQEATELNLRALRVVTTRLDNLLGEVSAEEATTLLAFELSEVDENLNLVGALAAVGASAIILMSHGLGIEPEEVIDELRSVMIYGEG